MFYRFYFVNNNRVLNEWGGHFDTMMEVKRFADGAAICAALTAGKIGVYAVGIDENGETEIRRNMYGRRMKVIYDYLNDKK